MAATVDEEAVLQGRDLQSIFQLWERKHSQPGFDPEIILTRLSEIFEEETEIYMNKDPDPFDERHPSRTDPECELGRMLKLLFRKDHFMTRLVNDYLRDNYFTRQSIQKSSQSLNIAACRLILLIMPGLETSAVFQAENDNLIQRLYNWAEESAEPLRSYATGLLGAAMEVQDIAIGFRENNTRLVPIALKRLHTLQAEDRSAKQAEILANGQADGACSHRMNSRKSSTNVVVVHGENSDDSNATPTNSSDLNRPFARFGSGSAPCGSVPSSPETRSPKHNGSYTKFRNTINVASLFENSQQSCDYKYNVRYSIPIHPATSETYQMLTLRYLASLGEYQEFLGQVFEHNALQLIFRYIENLDPKNTCLAFEALKYLASLLCHKKFSLEFINNGGLERLLKVPKPSISATAVSISLYYLAYCEDAMERICLMSQSVIPEVVSYGLWLLSSAHDSGRCHATMFFGLSFQFKLFLDEFDRQDGLRKIYNVISVLPILGTEDHNLNDDDECAARQMVRHVCVALKRYMESHLFYKYTQLSRLNVPTGSTANAAPLFRAPKFTLEMIMEQATALQELLPIRMRWEPVEKILALNGIQLMLRVIAYSYEWSFSGSISSRAETVRSALDVLAICCVIPKVPVVFCERMELPDEPSAAGINFILGASEGEIVADAEVQKSALAVLVHCVCAPINIPQSAVRYGTSKTKAPNKILLDMISKVWECVRSNNGIIVLLQLMETKVPITDADCIRGLACRAMAGLARSETVRQIISKLPLFTNGLLQTLMRDPILQEKRTEHVQFQKYALELLERVSGKSKSSNQIDTSLANIHRANVVAQTKIQFNEQQLYELVHEHLMSRGLTESANTLQKEANLPNNLSSTKVSSAAFHSPFSFRTPTTPVGRSRIRNKPSDFNAALNSIDPQTPTDQSMTNGDLNGDTSSGIPPIKLIKKSTGPVPSLSHTPQPNPHQQQRSLQKQISAIEPITPIYTAYVARAQQPNGINTNSSKNVTLETIITEYLTNQHALCKNPMSTCPQFDLIVPHKCPDPRTNKVSGLSSNFAARFFRQQAGFNGRRLDRRLIHSNFCAARTIRAEDPDLFFICCDIAPCATSVAVGSYSGEVKVYNINESGEEFAFSCHDSFISNIKYSRDGNFIATSTTWRPPLSALWSIEGKRFHLKHAFEEEDYMEFANQTNDRILGTKSERATIYDLNTGQAVRQFKPTIYNQYSKNRATYYPTDELILSDGVLWDVRSEKEIHKFDKLNQAISGVFHPNGLEVVSNTEVWDLRTFHLLRTVPTLDQCLVTFSPLDVIYGISYSEVENRFDLDQVTFNYEPSFKTLDSYDYSSIATHDVKRDIYDLSINKYGSQIAIVENQGDYESVQESAVRIYSVGRRKNMEDEAEEEDDDMALSDDGSSDDGSVGNENRRIPLGPFLDRDSDDDNDDDSDDSDENLEEWLNNSGSDDDDINIFNIDAGDDDQGNNVEDADESAQWTTTDDEDGND
ncbi:protein mahjong isoform X3 [Sitodiplosis mosellana]|uniref:protein mahjong isoform X3 n=1 Tax=Sitodiplosis mosellana TaxID=263140 RepID=UPI002444C3F3|nr:protein mahjong isoform X3 [Sitodiplosis mosellana]XP_055318556.1 protein mahjong isoform X3 [Sitodiplosis mosellana]XP_055318557.1 protein mahjong isoform X3 [Sitodiplosis mosellana]